MKSIDEYRHKRRMVLAEADHDITMKYFNKRRDQFNFPRQSRAASDG
jgi:hypothetical protein